MPQVHDSGLWRTSGCGCKVAVNGQIVFSNRVFVKAISEVQNVVKHKKTPKWVLTEFLFKRDYPRRRATRRPKDPIVL